MRNADCGMRIWECGMRNVPNAECGMRNEKRKEKMDVEKMAERTNQFAEFGIRNRKSRIVARKAYYNSFNQNCEEEQTMNNQSPFRNQKSAIENRNSAIRNPQSAMRKSAFDLVQDRIRDLRENTDFVSTLFESLIGYAIIAADFDGNIIAYNEGASQIYGYAPEEIIGKQNIEIFFPEEFIEAGELQRIINDLIGKGRYSYEGEKVRRTGEKFPAQVLFTLTRDKNGKVVGFIEIVEDLTERKRAEEALAASKAYAESIIQNFLDTLIVVDTEAKIQTVNPATSHLLGYTEEELLGQPISTIFEEEEEEEVHRLFQFFRETEKTEPLRPQDTIRNRELTYKTREGRLIPMSFNASVLTDEAGNVTGVVAGAKDITELKQVEKALQTSRASFHNIVERSADGIIIVDHEGAVHYVNSTAESLFGRKAEELVGEHFGFPIVEGKMTGIDIIRKDGEVGIGEMRAVETEWGEERAFLAMIRDVTERIRAEEEREKMQAQLLQAQKLEAVGTLTAGIAHDFNNLLLVIQSYADMSMMNVGEADPLHDNLKEISLTCTSAADLISKLLLFSRKQPMKPTLLNVNSSVNDLLKMLNRLLGEDIAVNTDLEPDLWTVHGDKGNIEQVIMNLAVNARDAMTNGGKLITKTENVTLDEDNCKVISEARAGKFVSLSVADTGVGIDKETIQHIFEPFFSTKDVGAGTGLGLSVVYGIIKQHGGWINVYSEPGQGSTFKVFLPASSIKQEEETEATISLQELQGSGERILVVEDEEKVRAVVTMTLRENGYDVFEAASAEEAQDIFEREKGRFHMVFSDVVMPGKSGIQLVEQLLSRKPELPVLLSSGYVDAKSHGSIIHERGFSFLPKPYALANLLRAIKETIPGYR